MEKRSKKLVIICDNDADNSFALEGELRNRNYEVVILTDATDIENSTRSLRPVAVLANPDLPGFNEDDLCRVVKNELNIPLFLLVDKHSTYRAGFYNQSTQTPPTAGCEADEVVSKPVRVVENVVNLIENHKAINQSNS